MDHSISIVPVDLPTQLITEVSSPKTWATDTETGIANADSISSVDISNGTASNIDGTANGSGEPIAAYDCIGEKNTNQFADSFVTEDEVIASLARKEEILESLSLSPSGSCAGGSLSQLSSLTKNSSLDEINLSAIRSRQNELINSLKSNLDSSRLSIASDDLNDEQPANISTSTAINYESVCDRNESSASSFQEAVPPAAKFSQTLKQNAKDIQNRTKYEEAFNSLNEILSSTTTDPDTILELYSSKLEAYKEEDDKKFDEIFSQIDNEKKFFCSIVEDPIGELEDQINTISTEKSSIIRNSTADNSVSSNNETLVLSQQTVLENRSYFDEMKSCETTVVPSFDENKDVENLIIGEDEGAEEDFDEDMLLASDDEVDTELPTNAAKESTKVWKEFQSTDEDENRDNNDPKWEYLKNLGSDYERYKAVQARWNNFEIPNPQRDLTCRCRNVRRSKVYAGEWSRKNEYGKRMLCSPENDRRSAKRPRQESCTVLFDLSIQKLVKDAENQRRQIEREQEQRLNELADQQSMDQHMAQQERKNDLFLREMKQRHYMEAESLMKDFRFRRDQLMESVRLKMDALRKAGDEVRQFHEFYPNKNGANGTHDANAVIFLTEVEVQEILEVEEMLIRFESFYSAPA